MRRHTPARTVAVCARKTSSVDGVIARIVRYRVESDATLANKRGCEARNSMSEHASPPAASINIACVNTVPRSWIGARSPDHPIADDKAGPSPIRSAKRPNACNPA